MSKLTLKPLNKKPTPPPVQPEPAPMTELVPPNDPSLPPMPAHIGKPVGPPPPPREQPRNYVECEERARQAAGGRVELAHLWAMLAQAHATKEVADKLDALNEYLGVYDEAEQDDLEDGETPLSPRLADVLSEGILSAASVIKDDLLSSPIIQLAMAAAMREVEKENEA